MSRNVAMILSLAVVSAAASARAEEPMPTAPNPQITSWGADYYPERVPRWDSPDVWIDPADGWIKARIRNGGSAPVSRFQVMFGYLPEGAICRRPAVRVAGDPLTSTIGLLTPLLPGEERVFGVAPGSIPPLPDRSIFEGPVIVASIDALPDDSLDDLDPGDNVACESHIVVELAAMSRCDYEDRLGKIDRILLTSLAVVNRAERPQRASLKWSTPADGIGVEIDGLDQAGSVELAPGEERHLPVQLLVRCESALHRGEPVVIDVHRWLDEFPVHGLTLTAISRKP